ncbi:MAG TPA: CGGC domain-containing protein [Thermodesulfobacteriota bacterium]|nr:CGGC domain-containing protein [Thermodesulfobacteriota bacterium]
MLLQKKNRNFRTIFKQKFYGGNPNVKLRAILHCGGCPGMAPVNRLANLKTWMAPMGETIDAIHIGTCLIKNCPYKDTILTKVKEKAGVEVIEGSHSYMPPVIFGG